VKKIRSDSGS
jgi:hypothetical protein